MNVTTKSGFCAAALALGIAACSNNTRPPESAMAEVSATEGGSAMESIAEARCARDSRCDNIGPEKRYSSMEDCVARVREDWRSELDQRSCPAGIVDEQLDECLNAVRSEECSSPFDTLERVTECTQSQICRGD